MQSGRKNDRLPQRSSCFFKYEKSSRFSCVVRADSPDLSTSAAAAQLVNGKASEAVCVPVTASNSSQLRTIVVMGCNSVSSMKYDLMKSRKFDKLNVLKSFKFNLQRCNVCKKWRSLNISWSCCYAFGAVWGQDPGSSCCGAQVSPQWWSCLAVAWP